MKALIFDLDDTLIPETEALDAAFVAITTEAAERHRIDAKALHENLFIGAKELWHSSAAFHYCLQMGINAWEALSADFTGPCVSSDFAYLNEWAPSYRVEAWRRALLDCGIDSRDAAEELAEAFRTFRRQHHAPYEGIADLLSSFRQEGFLLGLITNGASDLQRQKLQGAGLATLFPADATLVSSEVGHGKPEPEIFQYVMERLSVEPREAVMIGDNAERDIEGALGAGMNAVWIRHCRDDALAPAAALRIDRTVDLPTALRGLEMK